MELKEFVAETLSQIIEGVKLAQSRDDGSNVNAAMSGAEFGGHLVNVGTYGVATRVDFDVSVTAETKGGAGAKLSVLGVGVEGGAGAHSRVGESHQLLRAGPATRWGSGKGKQIGCRTQGHAFARQY